MALLRGTRLLLPTISQQLRHETLVGVRTSSTQAEAEKTASTVPATQPAEDQQSGSKTAEQEWTEVIDEQSGQTYYWNQKTGVSRVVCSCCWAWSSSTMNMATPATPAAVEGCTHNRYKYTQHASLCAVAHVPVLVANTTFGNHQVRQLTTGQQLVSHGLSNLVLPVYSRKPSAFCAHVPKFR